MEDASSPMRSPGETRRPLRLPALWEGWKDPAGEALRTFTIIATAANDDMARLHDRLPVILEADHWPIWLGEEGDHLALLRPRCRRAMLRLVTTHNEALCLL